jgi:hypothetical protein
MDDRKYSISPDTQCARLGSESMPIIDVRRDIDIAGDGTLVADAFHDVEQRHNGLRSGRQVDTYCFHGDELSQGVAAATRIMGAVTHSLEGRIANWTEQRLPMRRNTAARDPH